MDVIKTLKDIVVFAQKSNDIEMTQKLISVQQEVIEMQDKISKLLEENRKLCNEINQEKNVEHYRGVPIITLKEESPKVLYCGICYGKNKSFIPLHKYSGSIDEYYCRECDHYTHLSVSPDKEKLFKEQKL